MSEQTQQIDKNQKIAELHGYLTNKNTGFYDKNKFNSFESAAVMFNEFVEATNTEKEHMLVNPISDLGIVDEDNVIKVFLSDKAVESAESIKQKTKYSTTGKSAFIVDRVSKNDNGDLEVGWLNTVSKDHDSTIVSGVAFIRECEKMVGENGEIKDVLIPAGDKWVQKNKMSIFTIFPQFASSLTHTDQIKPFLMALINDAESIKTGQISAAIRLSTEDKSDAVLLEFVGKKNPNNGYADYSWDELKEMPDMQNKYAYVINAANAFIKKQEELGKSVVLEVMPALLHYPGPYTSKTKTSLSNATNYANYFLMTDEKIKDAKGKFMPLVLNGGRKSFVGVELNRHSVTKLLPLNFNAYANEFGFDEPSKRGKNNQQLKSEANKKSASPAPTP